MIKKHLIQLIFCLLTISLLSISSFASNNKSYQLIDANKEVIQTFNSLEEIQSYINEKYNIADKNRIQPRWEPCHPSAKGPHSITTLYDQIWVKDEYTGIISYKIVVYECKWCHAKKSEIVYV